VANGAPLRQERKGHARL